MDNVHYGSGFLVSGGIVIGDDKVLGLVAGLKFLFQKRNALMDRAF